MFFLSFCLEWVEGLTCGTIPQIYTMLLCLKLFGAGINMRKFISTFSVTFAFADETVTLLPIASLLPSLFCALRIFCLIWHFPLSFVCCVEWVAREKGEGWGVAWPELFGEQSPPGAVELASIPWLIPSTPNRQRERQRVRGESRARRK